MSDTIKFRQTGGLWKYCKLRSVMAQFHYAHEIRKFESHGIPFNVYMYVPDHHPDTNEIFYEREDEEHLVKVCILEMCVLS